MKRHPLLILVPLCVLTFAATWHLASVRWAVADPPSLVDAQEPGLGIGAASLVDGGIANPVPATAPVPPDPESATGEFVRQALLMLKTSWPGAVIFILFGAVTVARRRWPPARDGYTGILTASLLAFLTVVVGSLMMGVPIGQALGGGLLALLSGKAMATTAPPLPSKGGA